MFISGVSLCLTVLCVTDSPSESLRVGGVCLSRICGGRPIHHCIWV